MFRFRSLHVKQSAAKRAVYVTKSIETQGAIEKHLGDSLAEA
jgi:hypothetical protein